MSYTTDDEGPEAHHQRIALARMHLYQMYSILLHRRLLQAQGNLKVSNLETKMSRDGLFPASQKSKNPFHAECEPAETDICCLQKLSLFITWQERRLLEALVAQAAALSRNGLQRLERQKLAVFSKFVLEQRQEKQSQLPQWQQHQEDRLAILASSKAYQGFSISAHNDDDDDEESVDEGPKETSATKPATQSTDNSNPDEPAEADNSNIDDFFNIEEASE
jgi:hypothetical protein